MLVAWRSASPLYAQGADASGDPAASPASGIMTLANEKMGGGAQAKYDKGVAAMAAGQDKDAYKWFVQAYQEATK